LSDTNYRAKNAIANKQLVKFKFEDSEPKLCQTLLEDTEADNCDFDQFKGRQTDFNMNMYSVEMPQYVNPELRARADRLEREI